MPYWLALLIDSTELFLHKFAEAACVFLRNEAIG